MTLSRNPDSPIASSILVAAALLIALALASACREIDNSGEPCMEPAVGSFDAISPDPPPDVLLEDGAIFTDRLVVVSPIAETEPPRNAPVVFGGLGAGNLHVDPPHFEISASVDGVPIDLLLDGPRALPLSGLWPASEWVEIRVQAAPGNDCSNCFIDVFTVQFADRVDMDPPELDGVDVTVSATLFNEDECNLLSPQEVDVRLDRNLEWKAFRVIGRVRNGSPDVLTEDFFRPVFGQREREPRPGIARPLQSGSVRNGDEVHVVVSVVDHLDQESQPRVFRSQFDDRREFVTGCELDSAVVPHLPSVLPINGQLQVDFLIESAPLALEDESGERIPLYADDEVTGGLLLAPTTELAPSHTYTLVAEPCPQCQCPTCGAAVRGTFETGESTDDTPPTSPVLLSVVQDPTLEFDVESCVSRSPSVVVTIEPGIDDRTAPLELRYDAVVRSGSSVGTRVGRSLKPILQDDGSHAIRLESSQFTDLLDVPAEITLIAFDLARNTSQGTFAHEPAAGDGGCAQTAPAPSALHVFFLAWVIGRSRRIRSRRRSGHAAAALGGGPE